MLDSAAAGKLSGARFSVSRGPGALLERAPCSLLLDLHTQEHGYTEYAVPHLVGRETMTGTGQLPKFEEDLFATSVGGREMFLIPTAEVPLTNLVAREVLDERRLPLAMTARTPCYRAEAGSYGRDTRGILRLHQFEKVELVRVCRDEDAAEQLELMLGHVEDCLKRLELSYRVVLLPAGDIGFSARRTYDVEVWLPGSDSYREISSVSDCGTFQGRRAAIRYRTGGARKTAATLSGSGLPIGRTVAALLEQGQQADGSVVLPEALAAYTGCCPGAAPSSPRVGPRPTRHQCGPAGHFRAGPHPRRPRPVRRSGAAEQWSRAGPGPGRASAGRAGAASATAPCPARRPAAAGPRCRHRSPRPGARSGRGPP